MIPPARTRYTRSIPPLGPFLSPQSHHHRFLLNKQQFFHTGHLFANPARSQPQEVPERKSRKSVAFTDEQLVVDADGSITMVNTPEETKDSAESHAPRTPPLSAALGTFVADSKSQAAAAAAEDAPADDGGLDLSLLKKKKKKKAKTEDEEGDAEDGAPAGEDGGLDLSMKKKKKKSKAKDAAAEEDEFAAKLKQLEVKDKDEPAEAEEANDGDMDAGTGIWAHDETKSINYNLLLQRFFSHLSQKNPDHALSGTRSYKIPPPQCMREGNRKTVFANIADICKRMKRTDEHVTAYLFAELGTNGSVDGSRRLVIKGRFQQKQIENVVRKYISTFLPQTPWLPTNPLRVYADFEPQSSTSRARPASPPTPSSTRERTVCTSSPATTAVPDGPSPPSRLVSLPRSESGRRWLKLFVLLTPFWRPPFWASHVRFSMPLSPSLETCNFVY